MSGAGLDALDDRDLLAAHQRQMARLSALFAGRLADGPCYLNGVSVATTQPGVAPGPWLAEALGHLAEQAHRVADAQVFRPLCLSYEPFGVHLVDHLFGAVVRFYEGQWWSSPLTSPIGALTAPPLATNALWQRTCAVAEAFLATPTRLPLFGLPVIASALNVAINLYGERLLLALLTEPAAAAHDLSVINAVLCQMHRWYLERLPMHRLQPVVPAGRCQPPGFGQLCGCSTQLLSGDSYARFVAPLDDALLNCYPHGGMIHLCGAHTQHLAAWRAMRSLRAVQVNDRAAADLGEYFDGLREDQIIYLNPGPGMSAASAIGITGGRRLVIVGEP